MIKQYNITDYIKDDPELQKAVIKEFLNDIKRLQAENELLKDANAHLKTELKQRYDEPDFKSFRLMGKTIDEWKQLQAENEELKKEIWQLQHRKMWNKEATLQAELLIKENERLKEEIKSINRPIYLPNIEQKVTNKYRKALEEIRGILCKGRTFYDGYFENENLSRTDKAIKVINEVLK